MDRSLVVTFARPCQVGSWVELDGGFRTGVSYLLSQRVVWAAGADQLNRTLRQTVGKMALRGTVVGMATALDLHSHRLVSANDQEISVSVLSLLPRRNELEMHRHNSNDQHDPSISTSLLVFIIRRLNLQSKPVPS